MMTPAGSRAAHKKGVRRGGPRCPGTGSTRCRSGIAASTRARPALRSATGHRTGYTYLHGGVQHHHGASTKRMSTGVRDCDRSRACVRTALGSNHGAMEHLLATTSPSKPSMRGTFCTNVHRNCCRNMGGSFCAWPMRKCLVLVLVYESKFFDDPWRSVERCHGARGRYGTGASPERR